MFRNVRVLFSDLIFSPGTAGTAGRGAATRRTVDPKATHPVRQSVFDAPGVINLTATEGGLGFGVSNLFKIRLI